ncbi:MAG: MobH family relaxase [Aromatoleum sp.]|jgi:integrating conjugative element relaxase (TIGR03760 family)|uniref:MobH family relaxase n=1 Tax=Aromatoleum sp. TaxID=2307007 RepID=UPI002894E62B|nr:MobH family relaxase [Aromatoleum sp.]MDT3671750.1 MobH family relaxase [Aromatoleum sp.]
MIELAGACFLAAAALSGWLGWFIRRERGLWQRRADIDAKQASAGTPATGAAPGLAANRTGWLRVLDAPVLVQVCKLSNALQQIHRESKLSQTAWDRDIAPAILRYLQFVQLLPASEAHHHAHVGGLAAHTIEVIRAAVTLRSGYLLPKGGAAEVIDAQRDHWTYSVILAALLHDVGKTITDLRISIAERPDGPGRPWLPVCGDMPSAAAVEYEVRFAPKSERNYGAHRRLPLVLAPRIVPATALAFVAREPSVMRELEAAWSGDDATGVLAEIVRQADRQSAASNLQQGPRNQFTTATAVPLVDQLMDAMRRLLRQGALPLNRDGAAGWIGAGAAWFVAKRLADTVREEIARAHPDDGASIPGPAKNDRLFDSWQDYGLLECNPDTGQAIWYVEVRGEGYTHEFAMLKFPLAKLFDSADDYPSEFDGDFVVIPRGKTRSTRPDEPPGDRLSGAPKTGDAHPERQRASGFLPPPSPVPPPKPTRAAVKRSPGHEQPTSEGIKSETKECEVPGTATAPSRNDEFLSNDESATAAAAAPRKHGRLPPATRPVTPFVSVPKTDADGGKSGHEEPGDAACRFMAWVQQGIADGSIPYNEAGAPVHFVPEGMALVSPRTFREFAVLYGDDGNGLDPGTSPSDKQGIGIQRQVIKAHWHLVGPGNSNVHHFGVIGRGGKRVGKLAAVVIQHPERWFNPVPPSNPSVVPFLDPKSSEPSGASS